MKSSAQNNSEKFLWDSMRTNQTGTTSSHSRTLQKMLIWLLLFVSATYVIYTMKLLSTSRSACDEFILSARHFSPVTLQNDTVSVPPRTTVKRTGLEDIAFGIAASAKLWDKRKEYIKLWWNPQEQMRGIVWLDDTVKTYPNESASLPRLRVSGDTANFAYKHRKGHRSAIRISRIVSETLRSGETDNVRWFVMGDDDTVFVTENLMRVLNKYDHNQYFYIGSSSESHLQNIYFSYGMAYGGGGFAISYPLAKALEKMQDKCIQRYPRLYGSDDRMQACMSELGVPLTKELGFHQYDVYGNLFGLLAAHPVTPFVSLHHLDVVEPIFPNVTRLEALQRLKIPMRLDSAGLMQQSICYHKTNKWTISISWGFAVQIIRGVLSPREMEVPSRTFLNWYRRADYKAYAFNTRPVMRNPCQMPFIFYLSTARRMGTDSSSTASEYIRHRVPHPLCKWNMADPETVQRVEVFKKPDPHIWDKSPRRNCCRVLSTSSNSLVLDVGSCEEDFPYCCIPDCLPQFLTNSGCMENQKFFNGRRVKNYEMAADLLIQVNDLPPFRIRLRW